MTSRIDFLKTVVKHAAKEIRNVPPSEGIVTKEGRGNFLTAADMISENAIITALKHYFPTEPILSEETTSTFSTNDLLSFAHLWIIDPIDGTNNFRYERGYSCISIGYVESGIVKAGVVYNFYRDELFTAELGHGSFLNEKRITVSNETQLTDGVIATDSYYTSEETRRNLQLLLKVNPTPFILMKGSSVLTMCEVAAGRTDLYFHTSLKPWDIAAAFIIVQEAGGILKGLQGENITFLSPGVVVGNTTIVAQFVTMTGNTYA